jgi:predicted regulator of Ras-like GTPase activity (Roadblock/LC7/MglB family)
MPDLKGMLGQLATMPGVGLATLVDREGFLIEAAGEVGIGAEAAGALASCLAESSEGIGRELGRGMLQSMILDYESGMVMLHTVGPSAILAVVLRDATALGKLRYYVKKILPDMLRAI